MTLRATKVLAPRRIAIFILGLSVFIIASCGKKSVEIKNKLPVFPVSGTLMMKGEPMPDAQLLFYPVEPFPDGAARQRPHAMTDADGTFKVMTYKIDDGAPAGKYDVTVSWKGPLNGTGADADDLPEKVPQRYQDPKKSKLTVEIKEGQNTIPTWDFAEFERQASTSR